MALVPVVVHYEPGASSPITILSKEASGRTSLVPGGVSFEVTVLAYVFASASESADASWLATKRQSEDARGTSLEPDRASKRTEGAWLVVVLVSLESWLLGHVSRRRRLRGFASSVVRVGASEESSLSWHVTRGRSLRSLRVSHAVADSSDTRLGSSVVRMHTRDEAREATFPPVRSRPTSPRAIEGSPRASSLRVLWRLLSLFPTDVRPSALLVPGGVLHVTWALCRVASPRCLERLRMSRLRRGRGRRRIRV